MTLVAAGAIANFVLKLIRWKVDDKQTTLQNIESTEDTARQVYNAGKSDNKKYAEGVNLLESAKEDFHIGKYHMAFRKAFWAKDLFTAAMSSTPAAIPSPPESNEGLLRQGQSSEDKSDTLKTNAFIRSIRQVANPSVIREIFSALADFKRSEYLIYGGLTLVLILSILQVWQLFYPKVAAFGASGIDYVAAFLFGYASEALLSEALELAKKSRLF
jgi:hypothetical protein